MRWSLYFGPSRPPLCPVAPGSLAEQKASRTQLIFSHLQPAQTDNFSESRQTARTFKLSIFQWGQLISWRFCVEIQAVCFRLQDNIQTDTPFYCISIQCLISSLCRKGESDRDEMDLADCLDQCLFDCWNCTLETHSLMSNESSCCGQPCRPHCTLGIDRVVALAESSGLLRRSCVIWFSDSLRTHYDKL